MEIWKRTNLGYGRTDKNDEKKKGLTGRKMADSSPQVCVCTSEGVVKAGVSHCLFLCFVSVFKVITLVFPVRGQKLYFDHERAEIGKHLWLTADLEHQRRGG